MIRLFGSIIAYHDREAYWRNTRIIELTGGNWGYEKRVATDVDKIIHDLLGVRCPEWLDNEVSPSFNMSVSLNMP